MKIKKNGKIINLTEKEIKKIINKRALNFITYPVKKK